MLKLKLQYFGHIMRRVDSLEKTLMLGRIGGRRRRGQQRMKWLDGITDSMDMGLSVRSLRDLTQHLTTRADDNHAPPVTTVPEGKSPIRERSMGCQA